MLGILKAQIAAKGLTGQAALAALTPKNIRAQGTSHKNGDYTGKMAPKVTPAKR